MKKVAMFIFFLCFCAFNLSAQIGPSCTEDNFNSSSNGKYLQQLLSPSFDSNNLRTYLFDCSGGDLYVSCGHQYNGKFSNNALVKRGAYGLAITTNADKTPLTVTLDNPIKEPTIWLDVDLREDSALPRDFVFRYANGAEDRLKWVTDYKGYRHDLLLSNGIDAPVTVDSVWNSDDSINTIRFTLDNKNNLKIYLNYDSAPIYSFKSQGNGSALKSLQISPLYNNELIYNLEILSSPLKISNCNTKDFDDVAGVLNKAAPGDYLDDYNIKYGPKGRLAINKGPANKNGITPNGDYTYSYKFDLNGGNNFTTTLDVDLREDSALPRVFVFRYANGAEDRLKWVTDYKGYRHDLLLSNEIDAPVTLDNVWNSDYSINTIRFEKAVDQMKIFLNDNTNPVYSFKTQGNCLQELEFRLYKGEWIYGFSLKNN